jgi:hypothetical protein
LRRPNADPFASRRGDGDDDDDDQRHEEHGDDIHIAATSLLDKNAGASKYHNFVASSIG